jgi:DNA/RNA endonuclease G (NUC1)/PKD repeat protein
VNLKGYKLLSGSGATGVETHTIATDVVADSGEYVVFGNNANTSTNGGVPVSYAYPTSGTGSLNLSNSSATEWIAIRTSTNTTIDSVAYVVKGAASYSFPTGSSRALLDLNADNTIISGTNWATSASTYGLGDRGTPGQPNNGGPAALVTVRTSWVTPGTTFKITATAVDADGKPSSTNFTWSTANPSIATIDPVTGVATGVSLGVTTVTATASNGVSGSTALFVVSPGDVASVSISTNDPAQVPVGYTMPAFPTSKTTTNATVTPTLVWSSSNAAVATVSDLGYITGTGVGTAKIRATAPDGVYGEVGVTIIPGTAPTTAIYRNHLEFGTPTGVPAGEIVLSKAQYVSGYNPARGGPDWVSWDLNASQFGGAPRCNCFTADQTLPADVYHVVDFDYRNGGYDRGHMVQSESRTTTDQENATTFLLTNILPQGAENNQGPWSKFENYLNDLARINGKEIYVVAGGEYSAHPGTLKGEGKVAIPDYTWKVAVIMNGGQGLANVHSTADLQVIAVKMPNLTDSSAVATSVGMRNNPWEQYQVTVDQIERETGYDLLNALPNQIEILVEANDRAPVAATDGPYTGLEGSPVTLSAAGSSDPDGDVLTYAWDFGDGSTGTGASPQHTYADNGTYVVTLTVSDPAGAEATATTSVTVFNVNPTVNAFAGASILAHQTYAGGGSFADPGADSWTATVDYGDGDGAQPLALSGTGFNLSHTYDHAGTFTITVTVTDDDGGSGTRTATVTVTNLAPVVAAFAGATLLPHETYAAAGSFADPGPDSWTATVDYGDGSGAQPLALDGKSFSLSHTYAAAGSYTVTVTVTDDGGLAGTRTATVVVLTAQQALGNLQAQVNGVVGGGQANSLNAKLRNAAQSLNHDDAAAANGQIGAFINEVQAMVQSGRLTQAQGDALIAGAQRILDSLAG